MMRERRQQVVRLYHAVLEVPESERDAFLEQSCSGDYSLRREVESLLAKERTVHDFLKESFLEDEASLLTGKP